MLKLTTDLKVEKIRVIAEYKEKAENPVYLAILKAMRNQSLTTQKLQEQLSGFSLSVRAWNNILSRLGVMGYTENQKGWHGITWSLTLQGEKAAETDTFFHQKKGELILHLVDNEFVPMMVVKKEEAKGKNNGKGVKLSNKYRDIILATKDEPVTHYLKGSAFIFDKIENACTLEGEGKIALALICKQGYGEISIQDFRMEEETLDHDNVVAHILQKEYPEQYDLKRDTLLIPFKKGDNTRFTRNVRVNKPKISNTPFKTVTLDGIKYNAATPADAEKWRMELLRKSIKEYIFDDRYFDDLDKETRQKFKPFHMLKSKSKAAFVKELKNDPKGNFYTLAKLETATVLTF